MKHKLFQILYYLLLITYITIKYNNIIQMSDKVKQFEDIISQIDFNKKENKDIIKQIEKILNERINTDLEIFFKLKSPKLKVSNQISK